MAASHLDWGLCRSFLAVVREGSLSRAAKSLGLTQPTVGRHVEQLEQQLGTRLFVRSQRGLVPTDTGSELLPHAEAMAAAASAMARAAAPAAADTRGTVRIAAGEMTGTEVLPPMLAAFRESNTGIVVELVLSDRAEDLSQRAADLAVRMVRPTQGSLVAKRVGVVAGGLHASHAYLERHGVPRTATDLGNHSMIGYESEALMARVLRGSGAAAGAMTLAFRSDSGLAQLAAMRAGYGIGGCQYGIARRYPELVPVLPGKFRFDLETWVVMHRDARSVPRVQSMFRHLVAALTEYAANSAPQVDALKKPLIRKIN